MTHQQLYFFVFEMEMALVLNSCNTSNTWRTFWFLFRFCLVWFGFWWLLLVSRLQELYFLEKANTFQILSKYSGLRKDLGIWQPCNQKWRQPTHELVMDQEYSSVEQAKIIIVLSSHSLLSWFSAVTWVETSLLSGGSWKATFQLLCALELDTLK